MSFAARPPSTLWEPIPVGTGGLAVWAWFKPPHAPQSVTLQLPPEAWQRPEWLALLTLRQLAAAVGLPALQGWTYGGQAVALDPASAPWLDQPLPPPVAGLEPSLILWVPWEVTAQPTMAAAPGGAAVSGDHEIMFQQMAGYWQALLQLESDLRRVRMQLEQAVSRLSSLNRDLSSEEALAADNQDKKDWQDARRWLRDGAHGLNRSIKEIDIGIISGAGQRHRFDDLMKQHVIPRIPFAGMPQAVVDFEMLHKTAKNVLASAQTVLAKGSADGERRAQAVLNRIGQKQRQRRNKARGANA
jgi:hypothetical protein